MGYRSGIHTLPKLSFVTFHCRTSFADNNATRYNCIFFQREVQNMNEMLKTSSEIHSFWLMGNNSFIRKLDDWGFLYLLNSNYIFSASYSNIIAFECTVDSLNNINGLIMQNIISFILSLDHISTKNCNAEYDSVPTREENCYSFKNNHYHARISDFFSLNCVFIVALIHPTPSEDCWYDCDWFFVQNFCE